MRTRMKAPAFDHVLIVASDLERSIEFYTLIGFEHLETIQRPNDRVAVMRLGSIKIELMNLPEGKETLKVVSDEVSVPTFTEDVVKMVLLALEKGLRGTYHLTNSGKCSRYEWAKYFFDKKGIATEVQPAFLAEFPVKATRPAATPMANKRIRDALNVSIPTWQDATDRFIIQNLKGINNGA